MLYSHSTADRLLGCYLQNPSLIFESKYPIKKEEFQTQLHSIVFVVCHNLYVQGCKTITVMDVDQWLQSYTAQYNIFNDNNGMEYISTLVELTDEENFEFYYNQFKKFSCLNYYKANHFDVSYFYDETKSEESELEKLNNFSIVDILNYFSAIQMQAEREFNPNKGREEYVAGSDFLNTMTEFEETPLLGNSFQSGYLNAIFNGMYGLIIRGGSSGSGKSIISMGDLCTTTITEYYDTTQKKFVKNKSRKGAGLFINTELDLRKEIDPMIIAWISKVPRNHIIKGKYEEGERERVIRAREILLESKLYIVDDPEFTTKSLRESIKFYAEAYNVETICFDYIQNNGFVAKEISSETKVPQREDMVLLALTDRLKQIQRECGVCIITAIQLNGKEEELQIINEGCLAGGRATVRKTDGTMVMLFPTKKELAQVETLTARWNKEQGQLFENALEPNNVVHIVKGRGSEYPKYIKVFQHVDLGTSTTIDMFCTDKDNNPINVQNLIIEYED